MVRISVPITTSCSSNIDHSYACDEPASRRRPDRPLDEVIGRDQTMGGRRRGVAVRRRRDMSFRAWLRSAVCAAAGRARENGERPQGRGRWVALPSSLSVDVLEERRGSRLCSPESSTSCSSSRSPAADIAALASVMNSTSSETLLASSTMYRRSPSLIAEVHRRRAQAASGLAARSKHATRTEYDCGSNDTFTRFIAVRR